MRPGPGFVLVWITVNKQEADRMEWSFVFFLNSILLGVGLAMDARAKLAALNINARVVSMPCTNRFDRQSTEYRQSVLPPGLPVLAIETACTTLK